MRRLSILVFLAALYTPSWATIKTVTLAVPDMSCSTCPITVRKALLKVPGVSKAVVSLDRHDARVTFNDAKTSVEALLEATKDVGYPATLVP